jgi:hypothetical protein
MKHQLKERDVLANVTAEQWAVIKAIAEKQEISFKFGMFLAIISLALIGLTGFLLRKNKK